MLQKYGFTIALCLSLAISSFAGGWYINGNRWEVKHNELIAEAAKSAEQQALAALVRQHEIQTKLDEAYAQNKSLQDDHTRAMANAADSERRLRVEIDRIKALHSGKNSSAIAERANAATDARVLAELLGISDYLAGKYAEDAGRHKVALQACINEYNALR